MDYKDKLRRNITLFYCFNFFTGLLFNVGIWVAFERRILTFQQMALFTAVSAGIEMVLQIPTGAFADLFGRKKALILGWLIMSVSYVYEAFATTPVMFFIAFCAMAFGSSLSSGADVALVYDSLQVLREEKRYPEIAAKMKLFYRFAIAAATLTGGLLYAFNVRLPYLLLASAILVAIIFIFFMEEVHIVKEVFSFITYRKQIQEGFRELGRDNHVKTLVVYYTLVGGITWSCLNYFNLPFMSDLGYSSAQLGLLFACAYIVAGTGIYFLTKTKHILNRKRVYLAFPVLMIVGLLPGLFANKFLAPILLIIVMIAGSGRLTFLDSFVNEEFSSKYRATALSALNMLVSIFYIVVVTIGGKVQDIYGTKIIYTSLGILTILLVVPTMLQLIKKHSISKQPSFATFSSAAEEEIVE